MIPARPRTTVVGPEGQHLPPGTKAQIGVMAAAPEGKGFPVRFEDFSVTAVGP
jgi:regulation of enolase protein 1 (concanavalin A-like superfamily)